MEQEKKRGRPKKVIVDGDWTALKAEYNRRHYLKKKEQNPTHHTINKNYHNMIKKYKIDPYWIDRYGPDLYFLKKLKEIKTAVGEGIFINMLENCDAVDFEEIKEEEVVEFSLL